MKILKNYMTMRKKNKIPMNLLLEEEAVDWINKEAKDGDTTASDIVECLV